MSKRQTYERNNETIQYQSLYYSVCDMPIKCAPYIYFIIGRIEFNANYFVGS